jgi:hypothetical protein
MKPVTAALTAALLGTLGCQTRNESTVEGATAEIADIQSRQERRSAKAAQQVDRYVRHIEQTTNARDRKTEKIEGRLVPADDKAVRTVDELRRRSQARSGRGENEWATRLVTGKIVASSGTELKLTDAEGRSMTLKTQPSTSLGGALEPGTDVSAAYEVRGGENVATSVTPLSP